MHTEELQADAVRTEPFIGACDCVLLAAPGDRPFAGERLLPSLLASLAVHGLFVVLLLLNVLPAGPGVAPLAPASIRIRITTGLLATSLAEEAADTPADALQAPALAVVETAPLAVGTSPDAEATSAPEPLEPSSSSVRETVDVPAVAPTAPEQAESVAAPIRAPSTLNIRQLVESVPAGDGVTMQECTKLQQENPLIQCAETEAERAAARLPGLAGARMSSGAAPGIMLRRYEAQRERIRASGIEVPEYLDYQLDQIFEDFSDTSATPEVRMTDLMNLNNPAYQMIRSVTRPR